MWAEHVKRWLAAARRAEKGGSTDGGEERATATETWILVDERVSARRDPAKG